MKIPTDQKRSASNNIYQQKSDEREKWYKTVVKVLCWKDGLREGSKISPTDKITPAEWLEYCKGVKRNNTGSASSKTEEKLKLVKEQIQKNGGFV